MTGIELAMRMVVCKSLSMNFYLSTFHTCQETRDQQKRGSKKPWNECNRLSASFIYDSSGSPYVLLRRTFVRFSRTDSSARIVKNVEQYRFAITLQHINISD